MDRVLADSILARHILGPLACVHLFKRLDDLRLTVLRLRHIRSSSNLRFRSRLCADFWEQVKTAPATDGNF